MQKRIAGFFAGLLLATAALGQTWVDSYTRSDSTHVQGHYRSAPNSAVRDNYNYRGNTNPYTGQTGSHYYRNHPTSEYYGTERRSPSADRHYGYPQGQ